MTDEEGRNAMSLEPTMSVEEFFIEEDQEVAVTLLLFLMELVETREDYGPAVMLSLVMANTPKQFQAPFSLQQVYTIAEGSLLHPNTPDEMREACHGFCMAVNASLGIHNRAYCEPIQEQRIDEATQVPHVISSLVPQASIGAQH